MSRWLAILAARRNDQPGSDAGDFELRRKAGRRGRERVVPEKGDDLGQELYGWRKWCFSQPITVDRWTLNSRALRRSDLAAGAPRRRHLHMETGE